MALRGLTAAVRRELVRLGRDDLARRAVDRVAFTYDGTTLYVHLFPQKTWRRRYPGEAFVLAHADRVDLAPGLAGIRELVAEARLSTAESGPAMVRWLENR
jgi:hypothetical protein